MNKFKIEYRIDIANDGEEAFQKIKFLLNQGLMYDFIFINSKINEISEIDLAKTIRDLENVEKKFKNNLICITRESNREWDPNIYNDQCKKKFFIFFIFIKFFFS